MSNLIVLAGYTVDLKRELNLAMKFSAALASLKCPLLYKYLGDSGMKDKAKHDEKDKATPSIYNGSQ